MKNQDTLTLRTRPTKWILIMSCSLIFTGLGILMAYDGKLMGGLFLIGVFGICGVLSALQLTAIASSLRLTREGFTISVLFRSRSYRWSDIEEIAPGDTGVKRKLGLTLDLASFFVPGLSNSRVKTVVFNFSPSYSGQQTYRKMNRRLIGSDFALPETYGMSAKDLAELMKELKNQSEIPIEKVEHNEGVT